MIKLRDLLNEGLEDAQEGDAFLDTRGQGSTLQIVLGKNHYGKYDVVEFQFDNPYAGEKDFLTAVGVAPLQALNYWGKGKKVKITSAMKKKIEHSLKDPEALDMLKQDGFNKRDVESAVNWNKSSKI